jgi:hypothetical protein
MQIFFHKEIKAAYLFVLRNKNSYIRKKNQIFNADL